MARLFFICPGFQTAVKFLSAIWPSSIRPLTQENLFVCNISPVPYFSGLRYVSPAIPRFQTCSHFTRDICCGLISNIFDLPVTIPSVFNYLKRPEYIFRPRQALNRFRRMGKGIPSIARVSLPWGALVDVRPNDNVGSDIFYFGIFDRIVPEAIYRLADAGELLLEAGANIGQNCSLMVHKAGPKGKVIAFEPHPEIFEELKSNAALWPEKTKSSLQLENVALADKTGEAWLSDGSHFHHNRGTASLSQSEEPTGDSGRRYKVMVRQLDEYLPAPLTVGVFKIDVEGHELSVLKGAADALARGAIRDIIFEDFSSTSSPTVEYLRQHRFTVFQLTASWWKPKLTEAASTLNPSAGFSYNYLATTDPNRARARFQPGGWRCLMC